MRTGADPVGVDEAPTWLSASIWLALSVANRPRWLTTELTAVPLP